MNKKPRFFFSALIIFAALGTLFFLRRSDISALTRECDTMVLFLLKQRGINPGKPARVTEEKKQSLRFAYVFTQKEFLVPAAEDVETLKQFITANPVVLNSKFRAAKIRKEKTAQGISAGIDFNFKNLLLYRLLLRKRIPEAKIALVLDDWGNSKNVFLDALELPAPVTFAVLPNLPYSADIAAALSRRRHEYILHLPLEPHAAHAQSLEIDTIFADMSPEEILSILRKNIAQLPHLKGINNHMGSKATENEEVMGIIIGELSRRRLYFLDSYTSEKSIAARAAHAKGVPFLQRDIFIDNENDESAITRQLYEAKRIAEERGYAVAIGHARPLTVRVLREIMPRLQDEGVIFVYASSLLDAPQTGRGSDGSRGERAKRAEP